MTTHPNVTGSIERRRAPWRGRGLLALLAVAALSAAGCSPFGLWDTPSAGTARTGGQTSTGAGPAQHGGGGSSGSRTGASYTVEFARCMRSHGVPGFPDPGGQNPFAAGSGVDPGSAAYQAALNGPCRSLAPAGWLDSGPSINGGGGS